MPLLFVFTVFFSLQGFSQLRKSAPPVYKTIFSQEFSVGDRIAMSGLKTELVPGKYRKYTVLLNDSMKIFRDFLFAHPNLEFRVHALWKQMGRKFPSETGAVYDTLISYFRKPGSSGDNKLYVNEIRHSYHKQQAYVKLELEVIGVKPLSSSGRYASVESDVAYPDKHTIYRNFDNVVKFGVVGLAESEALWIESDALTIQYLKRGEAIVRRKYAAREVLVTVKSGTAEHPVNHGKFWLKVKQLPEPEVFLGTVKLEDLAGRKVAEAFFHSEFTARYPESIPLPAVFKVAEVHYTAGGKTYRQKGSMLTEKLRKKLEAAPENEVIIAKVVINGSRRFHLVRDVRILK